MNQGNWRMAAGVALLGLCSYSAIAQSSSDQAPAQPTAGQEPPAGGPHGKWRGAPGPEREVNMLTRVLNLTPDQQKGVRAVLQQQGEQMRAIRSKSQAEGQSGSASTAETPDARHTQIEQLREESNTKIAALLDENQKKTFAEWTARRKAQMERHRQEIGASPDGDSGGPPPPPPSE